MRWIIDRFEGEYALIELEDESIVRIPKEALPQEAKEGDILSLCIESKQTQEKKDEMKQRVSRLFQK